MNKVTDFVPIIIYIWLNFDRMSKTFFQFAVSFSIINFVLQILFAIEFSGFSPFQLYLEDFYTLIVIIGILSLIQFSIFIVYFKSLKLNTTIYLVCSNSFFYLILLTFLALSQKNRNLTFHYSLVYLTFQFSNILFGISLLVQKKIKKNWLFLAGLSTIISCTGLLIISLINYNLTILVPDYIYFTFQIIGFSTSIFLIINFIKELNHIKVDNSEVIDD